MRKSRIKKEIAAHGIASCVKLALHDPRAAEIAGMSGFPAIWICREHVPCDWAQIENLVRAAKIHDVDIIVRVSKGAYSDYIKPLECDAAGIMVPHVTSAKEAREIVDQCRFMPLGRRAVDGGNADGDYTFLPSVQYMEESNREKIIILQIESPEAVAAIDEIAAVEGYDFLLFGPTDYSHRIGKSGEIHAPEVEAARRTVEEAARRHGKACFAVGIQHLSPGELIGRGYTMVNIASDIRLLGQGMREANDAFRAAVPAPRA